jgi:hypothetical protein
MLTLKIMVPGSAVAAKRSKANSVRAGTVEEIDRRHDNGKIIIVIRLRRLMCRKGYAIPKYVPSIWGSAPQCRGGAPLDYGVASTVGRSRHRTSDGTAVGQVCPLRNLDCRSETRIMPG